MAEVAVVVPLVEMPVGARYEYGRIPLHVTVLPNFVIDDDADRFTEAMVAIATSTPALEGVALHDELFGQDRDIAVTEIRVTADIRRLHDHLHAAAEALGGTPVVPEFHGDGYRAHATVTFDGDRISPGDVVALRSLVLLDCTQPVRRVVSAARLG